MAWGAIKHCVAVCVAFVSVLSGVGIFVESLGTHRECFVFYMCCSCECLKRFLNAD